MLTIRQYLIHVPCDRSKSISPGWFDGLCTGVEVGIGDPGYQQGGTAVSLRRAIASYFPLSKVRLFE